MSTPKRAEHDLRRRRAGGNGTRGNTAIMVAIMIAMLLGFTSLVVDVGWMLEVRNELQNAADSASLAGAISLDSTQAGPDDAQVRAEEFSAEHRSTESVVAIESGDLVFGHWHFVDNTACSPAPCFEALGTSPEDPGDVNAVRVTTRRTEATGNPVDLFFGAFLRHTQADVTSTAIAVGGGPASECGFPLVVADCALEEAVSEGTCEYCMTFQDNNTDNAGWTSFDLGNVGGPTIRNLIRAACYVDGRVAVDPETGECTGECNLTNVGEEIQVNNGNNMNPSGNNFCHVIQDILRRGVGGGAPQPFSVAVPVLKSVGEGCDAEQFSGQKTIAGYATMEIYGAKCGNPDPGVIVPSPPCSPPPSQKYLVAALRCDLRSEQPAGGESFGRSTTRVRLVQ